MSAFISTSHTHKPSIQQLYATLTNSRPINIEELFPDREKMDTSYVEVLRKLDTPIIVITEDSEGECDAVAESDSDAEIVELEKNRGASVQKDAIDEEEVEDVDSNDKEGFEENTPELEKTKPNDTIEKADEEAPENEETIPEKVKVEQNEIVSDDPVLEDEKTEEKEGQDEKEIVIESNEEVQDKNHKDEVVEKIQQEIQIEKTENVNVANEVPTKIDRELLEKLVSLHGGWHDDELKKNIKQTPKGWQLISV